MEQLKDNRSRFNASQQIPANDDKLEKLENILKETSKAVNGIMHVHEQLRKRFCPGSSENAEMKRQKRSAKENKRKLRNRKKKALLKNARNLAVLLAGETFSNLFSSDEDGINEKITASHLTSSNHRMLTPRKHLNALKFLLEKEIFHKGAVDTVQSIISILQTRKSKGKICAKKRRKRFELEPGQQSLFDVLKRKAEESMGEQNEEDEDKEASDNEDNDTTEEEEDDATESEEEVGKEQKDVSTKITHKWHKGKGYLKLNKTYLGLHVTCKIS